MDNLGIKIDTDVGVDNLDTLAGNKTYAMSFFSLCCFFTCLNQ